MRSNQLLMQLRILRQNTTNHLITTRFRQRIKLDNSIDTAGARGSITARRQSHVKRFRKVRSNDQCNTLCRRNTVNAIEQSIKRQFTAKRFTTLESCIDVFDQDNARRALPRGVPRIKQLIVKHRLDMNGEDRQGVLLCNCTSNRRLAGTWRPGKQPATTPAD